MDTVKAYGPPGTGKTYTACEWVARQVAQGADPDGIAFVSFTNAACDEARGRLAARLDLLDYELDHCATLHALCRRALRIEGRDWLAECAWLKTFAEAHDYELQATRKAATEDLDEVQSTGGQDAILLAVWNWGRARLITEPDRAYQAYCEYDPEGADRVPYRRFTHFVRDYEAAKQMAFRKDYTDLLLLAVKDARPLPVSVVVVDEAQDMSPLLWAAADRLFAHAPARACLADDDQAIYSYQGAAPELFNNRPAEKVAQLHQSRRLPSRIVEHSSRIIRQNRNRMDKQLLPVTAEIVQSRRDRPEGAAQASEMEGSLARVGSLGQCDLTNGESWMVLLRNWAFTGEVCAELEAMGIPYRVQGEAYYSPWNDRGPLRAAKAIYALSEPDGRIGMGALAALIDKTRTETKERPGAWVYGAKTRLKEFMDRDLTARVGLMDLPALGLTPWGFDRIVLRDLALLEGSISNRDLETYAASQRRGTWGQEPRVVVSTIHGVKGQEADNVVAVMSCTLMPLRNLDRADRREEEIRLAYVGMTRARQRFFGLAQDRGFGYPYEIFGV